MLAKNRVAVITPYYLESIEILKQCHKSVLLQGANVTHFMIADGHPNDEVDDWDTVHIRLQKGHADNGNTPRAVGSVLAQSEGFDYIAYLDADNWFHQGHLSSLIELQETEGSDVCCSMRTFHNLEGVEMVGLLDPVDESRTHVDTSCFLIHKTAFRFCVPIWANMPKQLSPICDKVFYAGIQHYKLHVSHSTLRTLAFRTQYLFHYQKSGFPVPKEAKFAITAEPNKWMLSLNGVKSCLDSMGFYPLGA